MMKVKDTLPTNYHLTDEQLMTVRVRIRDLGADTLVGGAYFFSARWWLEASLSERRAAVAELIRLYAADELQELAVVRSEGGLQFALA